MTTKELIKRIAKETGKSTGEINSIIDSMTTVIGNALIDGEDVKLTSFGTFKKQTWKSRKIMNVSTGEVMETKPTSRVVFVISKELKKAL